MKKFLSLIVSLVTLTTMTGTALASSYGSPSDFHPSPNVIGGGGSPWYDQEPTNITVKMVIGNGNILDPSFGSYCQDVEAQEWGNGLAQDAYTAGAVAVRAYSWYFFNNPISSTYDITNDPSQNQSYTPGYFNSSNTTPSTAMAITYGADSNAGLVLQSASGEPHGPQYICFYAKGQNNSYRLSSSYSWTNKLYQLGSNYMVNTDGYTWGDILGYYYPGTTLVGDSLNSTW